MGSERVKGKKKTKKERKQQAQFRGLQDIALSLGLVLVCEWDQTYGFTPNSYFCSARKMTEDQVPTVPLKRLHTPATDKP